MKASVLAICAAFFLEMVKIAPNTLLPILKFQKALLTEHRKSPVTGSSYQSLENTFSNIAASLRMVFSHYRELAKFKKKRAACFRKAQSFSFNICWLGSFESYVLRGEILY